MPSLERLCTFLLDAGVSGLFVGGSTGEAAYLPDQYRQQVLEVVIGTAAGAVPVLAGAIDMTTPRVIEHARAAEKAGADGIVATAPFYAPTHLSEIAVHFTELSSTVDLPLLAYDIPSAVGTKLPPELLAHMASGGILAGVKDSSGDLESMRKLLGLVDESTFAVFTGSETLADLGLLLGARGIVPGIGNVDPHGYVRLAAAAKRGDWEAAKKEQERLRKLFEMITAGDPERMGKYSSAIGAFKAALARRGIFQYATTSKPMIPLKDSELTSVRRYLEEAGLV